MGRVRFNYRYRTGEGFRLHLYNVDSSTTEYNTSYFANDAGANSSLDWTFAGTTNTIYFRVEIRGVTDPDAYDENDYIQLTDAKVWARFHQSHTLYGSEVYTNGNILKDALLLVNDAGAQISTDFTDITDPGYTLSAFTAEVPKPAAQVIDELLSYGDTSYNTYGFAVWDETGTSDGLPRCEVRQYDTSDYEYIIDVNDPMLTGFQLEKDTSQIYNYVIVQYVNEQGLTKWRTPTDTAGLKDQTSIDTYYRREYVLKIGKATSNDADNLGQQFLTFHKNPKYTGSAQLRGTIQTKSGLRVSVSGVKAGERVYLADIATTIQIRQTQYDAETDTLTIYPNPPINRLDMQLATLRREATSQRAGSMTVG